ncbi:hypothetical protein [Stenotrophobium rhamnosiphilum]|uniref:Uncharacterized protein n=1 Tax=Stenotrophobium rhamnosiphilum TaxID=2029166 RepID=A0A2T5MFZ8_9GAMM|nr:hypothetical protein [Stenotrophobium rhamnosiphilum]PTU31507.1 hypothetical protein CJD38_09245 [Stenotrophobium rhamnosiphilum]
MANKQADELRSKLKPGAGLEFLNELDKDSLTLLNKGLDDAKKSEHQALDKAIEGSMTMIPFLLRGAFKKILFP